MKTREEIANELYGYCLEHIQPPPTPDEVKVDLLFFSTIMARDGEPETIPEDQRAGYMAGQKAALREIFNDLTQIVADSLNHDEPAGADLLAAVRSCAAAYIDSWKDTDPAEVMKLATEEMAAILKAAREAPAGTYNLPTGPFSDAFLEILAAGSNLPELPERKKRVTHSAQYAVYQSTTDPKHQKVTKTTQTEFLSFDISDITKFTGTNAPAKNLFMLSLIEINKQALNNGVLVRDYISFPLQTLVDAGIYKDPRSARRGFMQGADALTSIKVSGFITQGKEEKQVLRRGEIEVLYTGGSIKNSICEIYLNPRICWAAVAPYFSIIPTYYFKLPNRAQDLLYYIFYLARQNADKIEKSGSFTISFKSIHSRLNLPEVNHTINPTRDIVDVIEGAIEIIEEQNKTAFPDRQFNLLPIYPKAKGKRLTAAEFIEKGKLKVSFSGELAQTFKEISKQKTKKVTATQKKAARIEEKAAAIKKAKST